MTVVTLVLAGLALGAAAVSFAASLRGRRAAGADGLPVVIVAGALLTLVLGLADRGAVLSWKLGVGSGDERTLLPGVGLLLGSALLAATGGTLLLGIRLALPAALGAGRAAIAALWGAAAAAGLGVVLAVVRLLPLGESLREAGLVPLALIGAAATGLGLVLFVASGPAPSDASGEDTRAVLAARVALALAVTSALACGLEGWWRAGTYATALTAASASAALVGGAAAGAPARFALVLRGLLVVALLGLLAV